MSSRNEAPGPTVVYSSAQAVLRIAGSAEGDTIILLGQTGGGKSSIANAVLNLDQQLDGTSRYFKESPLLKSCTDQLFIKEGHWFGDGSKEKVTLLDTPGFLDTENRTMRFLTELVSVLENFPQDRLRLIVVTLPLTAPKCDSSYGEMLEIIDQMFGPGNEEKVWKHVVFVFTCANQLRENPELLQIRHDGWKQFLTSKGVDDPQFCDFDYGNPRSLEPLRTRFNDLTPYTPEATTELVNFLRDNPAATMADKIEQSNRWRDMQEQWTEKLRLAEAENHRILGELQQVQKRSKLQERRFNEVMAQQKKLDEELIALRNRPPQVIHVPSGGGRGGGCCLL